MPLIDVTLPLGSDPGIHPQTGAARLVNCFARPQSERGKVAFVLEAVSGLQDFATLTDGGGVRALLALSASDVLAVAGRLMFRVDNVGTATVLGGITSDGPVSMALNNVGEVAIVCDGLYYGYTDGVLRTLEEPDLPAPRNVCIIGGYFVFMLDDGRLFASELNDWDVTALSYATAEQSPDKGVVAWVRGDDLLAGGERSIEVWQVTGDTPFPLRKVTSVIDPATQQTIGVLAPDGAIDGVFVASDKTIKQLNGYQAQTISWNGVNQAIAEDPIPRNISVTRWSERGHTFYAFTGTSWTWVYDATTQKWHQRESYLGQRWKVSKVMQVGDRLMAGDAAEGRLYTLTPEASDEAGEALVMQAISVPVASFPTRLRHAALHVDAVRGVGTAATPAPQLMIDWTEDGVHFGPQLTRALGAAAQTRGPIRVNQLGSSFVRSYRFSCSAAVKRLLLGAKIDVQQMGVT